jgi:hypothetical protein
MDNVEISKTIDRLRRAQPRNADTMAVCDALAMLLVKVLVAKPASQPVCPECERRRQQTADRVRRYRSKT